MNLINNQVHHRQFGDGVIKEQTASMVTIQFAAEYGVKKFLYPSSFESFLILRDSALSEQMDAELCAMRERSEAERRQHEEETELRRKEEEQRALLEQNLAVAKRRAPSKKTPPKPKAPPHSPQGKGDKT